VLAATDVVAPGRRAEAVGAGRRVDVDVGVDVATETLALGVGSGDPLADDSPVM
jgi:hypothetical protein